jgi:hypothetical protein
MLLEKRNHKLENRNTDTETDEVEEQLQLIQQLEQQVLALYEQDTESAEAIADEEASLPLLIRLLSDLEKLPAGIAIELPLHTALWLIRSGLARPIGDMTAAPDLIVDEDQLEHAGLSLSDTIR